MTRTGMLRQRYSREVEPRPAAWPPDSQGRHRFDPAVIAWCRRADEFFADQIAMSLPDYQAWEAANPEAPSATTSPNTRQENDRG